MGQACAVGYENRFRFEVWTSQNDAKTLRVDTHAFENGEKKLRTDTCKQSLRCPSHHCAEVGYSYGGKCQPYREMR